MRRFAERERRFLGEHEVCHFATASKEGVPHVTPVVYALDGESVIIAIDYGTKKFRQLKENRNVSLVVDEYNPNRGIVMEGTCELHERGSEYLRLLQVLFDRFDFYRKNPWKEGESPIIECVPGKIVSWGI